MTDTPWTPGPWVADGNQLLGADGAIVDLDTAYISEADLRLIAAAPDMVELLERYVAGPGAYPSMLDEATTLLTRIRGES